MPKRKALTAEEQHARMLGEPVVRLVAALSVPTVASQLVSVVYNTADTYFVSRISTAASAAVGVVFSVMSIIQAVGYGLGMGCASLISRCLGRRENDKAAMYAVSALFASLLLGGVIGLCGLLTPEPLLRVLGATPTMLPHAVSYARYIFAAAPLMCASFVLNNILRAAGESALAMWGLCSGSVLNIILDPLLIFGLDMGTAGAALATAAGQAVSFAILMTFFLTRRSIIRLSVRRISCRPGDYLLIISTGLPTIFRQGLGSLSAAALNVQAAACGGDAAVAAVTIANKVYMLVRSVVIGIGQGFQPVAGYNYGAGDRRRTKKAFEVGCAFGSVVCVASAVVIALFAEPIMYWFRDDPEVARIGVKALLFGCAVMPVMAYSTYVNQLYQCLGFKLPATFLASCRQGVCFLPLILALPPVVGLIGVQLAQPGADLLTFLISVPFQIVFYRKHLREGS